MPRKKKKNNYYFTEITEKAIIDNCNTDSLSQRTKLYVEHIQPAFDELVDKIVLFLFSRHFQYLFLY